MQEYKICPFCGKAVEAEEGYCTFCNGFLQYAKPVSVSARRAALINDPASGEIKPVANVSETHILLIQFFSGMTAVMYVLGVYAQAAGIRGLAENLLMMFSISSFLFGTWVSFGLFLKKFSGTADIARPLINMNFYFIASILTIVCMGYTAVFSQNGSFLFILTIAMVVTFVVGVALFLISAVRMLNAPDRYMPLPVLGKVIIASVSLHIIIKILEHSIEPYHIGFTLFEAVAVILAVIPFVYLILFMARCRKNLSINSNSQQND